MSTTADDFSARVRKLELDSQSNADGLAAHEDLCAERYKNIHETMATIKSILLWFGGALLAGMAAILVKQVFG